MDGQQKRQWGVTSAISEAQPTDKDIKLNDQLVAALKDMNNFETPAGTENRVKALNHLQKVVEEFVRRASKAKNLPASTVENSGGKIFTFGSYALGVFNPSSDIDTVIIAPKHVYVADFFEYFEPTFREMTAAEDITEFVPVKEAFVPIIKMQFRGVPFDLLFTSLPTLSSIPANMSLLDRQVLRGLDESAMRSVNGPRVCAELLESVPQVKSFRHATRAVKVWAEERGVYGAIYGYPGGVAWAIMVARICQLYPFATGATVLSKFFNLMLKWHWPRPVMLKSIEEPNMGLKVWNPSLYGPDRAHLMPVITPAFPSMCSTHTIGRSTKAVMLEEFKRADEIINAIHTGRKTWADLFERHTFFTKDYKYYLSVVAASRAKEAHEKFSGFVKSKVRLLVKGIEDGDAGVRLARPYNHSFYRVHRCANEDQVDRVSQGHMEYKINPEEATNGDDSHHIIYTDTFYIGLALPEVGGKSLDISYPVSDFKRIITISDSYDADNMSVRVTLSRNHQLPDDIFMPGEVRPTKAVKEKKKKMSSKTAKRSFAETGLDDSEHASTKRRESENVNGLPTPTPA